MAFALKCLQVIHIIGWQVMVDIFFVDWERSPDSGTSSSRVESVVQAGKRKVDPISIWRTNLIANKWNDIQTERSINPYFQLLFVMLLLEVVGLKNMTGFDSNVGLNIDNSEYRSDPTIFFRFPVGVFVYVIVGEYAYNY